MSIRIEGSTQPGNIYYAECESCSKISEENGDFLPGNFEIASFGDDLTLGQVKKLAEEHEQNTWSPRHNIVIRGLNIKRLQEILGYQT